MKTLAFAGSNSSTSINHKLVTYAAEQLAGDVEVISLLDYKLPMYNVDIEKEEGFPDDLEKLYNKLRSADRLIISVAEHNGNPTAFFKNILDWLSRNERQFLKEKKITVLSAAPGKGGGASARAVIEKMLPHFGAEITGAMSVSTFYDVFKDGKIVDEEVDRKLKATLGVEG